MVSGIPICCVEECADSDPCGLNTDLQPTNTTVEMDCATGIHGTWSDGYINQEVRREACDSGK